MGVTDFLEGHIGSHIFRTASYPKPTELYVGFFLDTPDDLGDLTNEVSGGGYARPRLDPGDENWGGPTEADGTFFNLKNIELPQQTTDWGTLTSWAIFDEGANMLLYGDLVAPVDILLTTAKGIIPPGYLQITVS